MRNQDSRKTTREDMASSISQCTRLSAPSARLQAWCGGCRDRPGVLRDDEDGALHGSRDDLRHLGLSWDYHRRKTHSARTQTESSTSQTQTPRPSACSYRSCYTPITTTTTTSQHPVSRTTRCCSYTTSTTRKTARIRNQALILPRSNTVRTDQVPKARHVAGVRHPPFQSRFVPNSGIYPTTTKGACLH
jgi:hypothetical protein